MKAVYVLVSIPRWEYDEPEVLGVYSSHDEASRAAEIYQCEDFRVEPFILDSTARAGEEVNEEEYPGLTPYSVDITKDGDIYAYGVLGLALFDRHARLNVQNIINEAGESLSVGTYRLWAVDEKQAVEYAKARWVKDIESGEWDEEERIVLGEAE